MRRRDIVPTERNLLERIAAFEIDASVAKTLRRNTAAALQLEGVPRVVALRVSNAWCRNGDFLRARLAGNYTHAAGNPPYSRGGGTSPDACVEFVSKSFHALLPRGRLAMICPLSMASAAGASALRHAVAVGGTFDGVSTLEPSEAFTTHVDVIGGLFRATRGNPRKLNQTYSAPSAWMAGPADAQQAVERLADAMLTLEEAGCRVKLGMATGCNDVFVGYPETLAVEADLLVPIVEIADLSSGNLEWRGRYVVNTHGPNGMPWRRSDRPRLYAYLLKKQARLLERATVKHGRSWRLTLSRVDQTLAKSIKLLVPETGRNFRVVLDQGGHMPLNSVHAITSSEWPIQALHALLGAAGIGLHALALSLTRNGGHLRLNATGLRRVRVPCWRTLSDAGKQALLAGSPSKAAEAAARIYGLDDRLLRRCAGVGWEAP
jgi:hypothetical protein